MKNDFFTRQVVARHLVAPEAVTALATGHAAQGQLGPLISVSSEVRYSQDQALVALVAMVLGVDSKPRRMQAVEVAAFGDPFTQNFLLKGRVPLTLADLAAAIDTLDGSEARPIRKLYVIAEGASFQAALPRLELNTRLVFTWQKDSATPPDFLLSTVPSLDDETALLQLIAWSEAQGAYHFFERSNGAWAWAGNSFHALTDGSRGQGPFDSHINGGLVMKELKAPWIHWHSQALGIPRELIFDSPALQSHPLFAEVEGAEVLETAVRTGVRRWTRRRMRNDLRDGVLSNLPWYARQILWTTSINLVSSELLSVRLAQVDELALPRTFFFDEDGIAAAALRLDPTTDVRPPSEFVVKSALYLEALGRLEVHVTDGQASVVGDTNFAFTVPERAFEDFAAIDALMGAGILSARLALCLLMVDFSNPVFSPVRAGLLDYFPATVAAGNDGASLDAVLVAAIRGANAGPASAEQELLLLWDDPQLVRTVQARLLSFSEAVRMRLRSIDGVLDLLKLADSRNIAFRNRKLNEFRHTTARNGATVAHLAMKQNATLFEKTAEKEK